MSELHQYQLSVSVVRQKDKRFKVVEDRLSIDLEVTPETLIALLGSDAKTEDQIQRAVCRMFSSNLRPKSMDRIHSPEIASFGPIYRVITYTSLSDRNNSRNKDTEEPMTDFTNPLKPVICNSLSALIARLCELEGRDPNTALPEAGFQVLLNDNGEVEILPITYYKFGDEYNKYVLYDKISDEQDELEGKISQLIAFKATDKFSNLPYPDRAMLDRQLDVMQQYSECLTQRLAMIRRRTNQ